MSKKPGRKPSSDLLRSDDVRSAVCTTATPRSAAELDVGKERTILSATTTATAATAHQRTTPTKPQLAQPTPRKEPLAMPVCDALTL